MVYWGGGDGETGRGRQALGLEVTWVLPQLPAISKTCVTPKEVFCIHFSIFQVDQLSPSASGGGWEHSRGPWTACCFAGPQQGVGGAGHCHLDRGESLGTWGRRGFRINCWGGNNSVPSSWVLEHYSPLWKGTMGLHNLSLVRSIRTSNQPS